ncbi:TRAP transporter small permease [Stappia sp. F7233]|uniref:TRAP transporter small permease protein n=1 Tax=Stappia albiluteola TaxID=2758565 RepID=A0A839AAW4_9HYPH|nr:TRAP transporter small permease subunit [Stappia albiluteola]MBA5775869.1 TRAP transporter small permease [Stappia albiluteola]
MPAALRALRTGAEGVAAAMLAAMFFTFVLQIVSRYVFAESFGWTLELCLTLWIWIVFWGNAFILRDRDHVTFDILYLSVPPGARRVLALVSAATIVVGFAVSLWPTWDYIDFLKIKKSATLKIPLRTVFSIYAVFIIAVAIRYAWRFVLVARKGVAGEGHHHLTVTDE